MSDVYKQKEQYNIAQYPTCKLIFFCVCNDDYGAFLHIPEYVDDISEGICPYDDFGNGEGKDYYGNPCK